MSEFHTTINGLIERYKTHRHSPYRRKLRFGTRKNYDSLMGRIERDIGTKRLSSLNGDVLTDLHDAWTDNGKKIPIGHSLIGMLRTLVGFGFTFLEDGECDRLSRILHKMRFEMGKSRSERLTATQADAIRTTARTMNLGSIALAQAFQFEGMLRQRDVIGEFVPDIEPGESAIHWRGMKWLRGIRWDEVDEDLILRHVTSKRQKLVEKDLKLMPMVLVELQSVYCELGEPLTRARLPAQGAIIINEKHGYPYLTHTFRRTWREVATAAGVPKTVKNMDSRAGAISEATDAGADLEHIRHAATHSDIAMTQRYSRGGAEKDAKVQAQRVAHRADRGRKHDTKSVQCR